MVTGRENRAPSWATPTAVVIGAALIAAALHAGLWPGKPAPTLGMATCSGAVAQSPDQDPFVIALDKCERAIDDIEVKTGFLTKWTICGGAKSFDISLEPRAVTVTSDATNCSTIPSEVHVTYVGPIKK